MAGVRRLDTGARRATTSLHRRRPRRRARRPRPCPTTPGPWDWPTYGHDAQHTFHGRTTLDRRRRSRHLRKAWVFPTGDAVTATPDRGGRGRVRRVVGRLLLRRRPRDRDSCAGRRRVKSQNGVKPYPGEVHRDLTSDGGLITSSAWFEPAAGARPALVIFGGGYTLYALNAANGAVYWEHDYTGRPDEPPDPEHRRHPHLLVAGGRRRHRALRRGRRRGRRATPGTSSAPASPPGTRCGSTRPTSTPRARCSTTGAAACGRRGPCSPPSGLVVYGTADCDFSNAEPLAESVLALRVRDGHAGLAVPPAAARTSHCDWDFGATANAGVDAAGNALVPRGWDRRTARTTRSTRAPGRLRWQTNVVFGGFSGGFIATTAYDGTRVYGATAIGDFGRFESNGSKQTRCDPSDQRDTPVAGAHRPRLRRRHRRGGVAGEPGRVVRRPRRWPAGMTFDGLALSAAAVQVRDGPHGQAHRPGEAAPGELVGDRHRGRRRRARAGLDLQPQGGGDRGPDAGRGASGGAVGIVSRGPISSRRGRPRAAGARRRGCRGADAARPAGSPGRGRSPAGGPRGAAGGSRRPRR